MLNLVIAFLGTAVIAALAGLSGIAGDLASIAWLLFFVFVVLFGVSAVLDTVRGRGEAAR